MSTSPLDLAVLGLLTEQELHGYELKKRLGQLLGTRASVSFGSLYPALSRLERQGLVKAVEERTAVTTPMSGSLAGELAAFRARVRGSGLARGGRGKKVYGITDAGRARLAEALADPDVADDRTFSVRVAFAGLLHPAQRLDLFDQRRAELVRRRADKAREPKGTRFDTYRRSLLEREVASIDSDLTWLDGLIAAERQRLQEETA
ncbi:MAG: PadR family transcriptional regulator [Acidimicrobiia bacterium]